VPALATLCVLLAAQSPAALLYELTYDSAAPGTVRVEIRLPESVATSVLVMPRAIPMGYADVPYDSYVRDVQAFGTDGAALEVTRAEEGPRWRLGDGQTVRKVRYRVDLETMEREVLGASDAPKARPGYVGLLGYSVFAFPEGVEKLPIRLTVRAPEDWPVFLTLDPRAPPGRGTARAGARDFYALADSQVAMGPDLEVLRLEAPVPLFVAQYAERRSDAAAFGALAAEALKALAAYFGSVPFSHYTVHAEFLEPRSPEHSYNFSMEHMESCTIFFDTTSAIGNEADATRSRRHLYNLAHHIAHAWIPKRWAGEGYFPWSWELSPVIDSIWFSEGWGQYAAAAALAGPGGLGEGFRQDLVNRRFRASLEKAPGFLRALPLVAVSRIASTRYSEDFRTGRNVFSRGGLMAWEMDEAIRAATDGRRSLRDVLRRLLAENPTVPLDLDHLPDLCRQATGVDVSPIYRRWLGSMP
jgi:predicted metalloprotease with PDZ domain